MSDRAELRRLGPDDWEVLRDIRLRALAESPDAFGSTLDRERDFDEKEWRRRLVRPVYAVMADERPVAMAGAFTDEGRVQVWGMWTDPEHRGRGHARALLDALVGERCRRRAPGLPAREHGQPGSPGGVRALRVRRHRRARAAAAGVGAAHRADAAEAGPHLKVRQ